jgi:hypothetical protein
MGLVTSSQERAEIAMGRDWYGAGRAIWLAMVAYILKS